jgi:omega-6 fatty acid desaturase (delta-12 desaturase)
MPGRQQKTILAKNHPHYPLTSPSIPTKEHHQVTTSSEPVRTGTENSAWRPIVARYQTPNLRRSLWQITNTHIPYVIVWLIMVQTIKTSFWLTLPFIFLAAGLLIRNFIIFHDCGHQSFFASRRANDVVGFLTGVLSFTPYIAWRHDHALHHASSGDLDRRGNGDVWMMTVTEYLNKPAKVQLLYRFYRNPIIQFLIMPIFAFFIFNRLPLSKMGPRERRSVIQTNVVLAVWLLLMGVLIGFKTFAILQLSVSVIAAASGMWLFYVQHQYEGVYWEKHESWDYARAAVEGSSFYKLPKILQWFTGNIGYHHIHHLSPRIPNYNLEACHHEITMFEVKSITLWESFGCLRFRLWDEDNGRLISFGELKQLARNEAHLLSKVELR